MKKTVSLLLALVLLASLFLSNGVSALAAEGTEPEASAAPDDGPEEQEPLENPLPQPAGFDFRDVYVSCDPDSGNFFVTLLNTKHVDKTGMNLQYGIAAYNIEKQAAEDIPDQEWQVPDEKNSVVFKGINETAIVLTSAPVVTPMTPAMYFNAHSVKTRGVVFIMPEKNVYNLIEPVDPAEVVRSGGNSVTVKNTEIIREYALFDKQEGKIISEWEGGTGGDLLIVYTTVVPDTAVVVTRLRSGSFIKPDIPVVEPGADLAFTKTGFSPLTGMAVLTIQATPGLAYAIASGEDGHILNISERTRWGITAETEKELNVMADETDFYSTPVEGKEIRFRVPPGGSYNVVTRLPDGSTNRPDKPYQVASVQGNLKFHSFHDPSTGETYSVIIIDPSSSYAEYALRNKKTGSITQYYYSTSGRLEIKTYDDPTDIEVIAKPIPLSSTPPGQNSPSQGTFPPLLDKRVRGFGATIDNKAIEVEPFAAYGDGTVAISSALSSEAGKTLDPTTFAGAAVGLVTVGVDEDAFPLVILYDGDGKPSAALYYYDDAWCKTVDIDIYDKDYTVYFQDGLNGDVLIYNYALTENRVGQVIAATLEAGKKGMDEASIESQLWDQIANLQGSIFKTSGRNGAGGVEFTYSIKRDKAGAWCGEMFVSTKEKSITRATVMKAYRKAVELGGDVSGPKKLGTFGASYLYSIFQRLGVVKNRNA